MNIHYFAAYVLVLAGYVIQAQKYDKKKGLLIGSFPPDKSVHGVSGKLYAIDKSRMYLEQFNYDGKGPDAYFWISTTESMPDDNGVILPYNNNDKEAILTAQTNMAYVLTLPAGVLVDDLKYLSVWCKQFSADFGHIAFPSGFTAPEATDVNTFGSTSIHGVSASKMTILDSKRIRIEEFSYDGTGPDAFFMAGRGEVKAENGVVIPNEMGSLEKLSRYEKKDIVLMLPADWYTTDIDWFSVYCKQAAISFGDVTVPADLNVPPYMDTNYYGEEVGELTTFNNNVHGKVYVIDNSRLWLREFSYDGLGASAHFYVGKRGVHDGISSVNGLLIADENGSTEKLGTYERQDIVLTLPADTSVTDVIWLAVISTATNVNLGSIIFPTTGINVPEEVNLGRISGKVHGVRSGDVVIVNKRQIRISDLYYDGQGPDVFFMAGKGSEVNSKGVKIPDEDGSLKKLGRYEGKTIILTLPRSVTVDDIDWLSVYCLQYTENFGDVRLPQAAYHVPPYIEPETLAVFSNCESLNEDFNVAWNIDGADIELELTGIIDTDNGYMAFGLSGNEKESKMIGADVMVAFMDNGMVKLEDYTINQYSLCSGGNGVCPDTKRRGTDNLQIVSSSVQNGVTSIRFRRPLRAVDASLDKPIRTDGPTFIVWAMGNVNSDMMVTKHKARNTDKQSKIEFGRIPADNCRKIIEDDQMEEVMPWKIPKLNGKDVKVFRARIGPTGGRRGYEGITGQVSWGIAWYINGYLIPEIIVKRGDTYVFKVEGGDDPSNQAKYHPLYITDDPKGGYSSKDEKQRKGIKIFAGVVQNRTGLYGTDGRYCEYTTTETPEQYETFEAYSRTLVLTCDDNKQAGQFTWTVSMDTPDLVYYQCFTHNYLGWKIHVVDEYPEVTTTSGARGHVMSKENVVLHMLTLGLALVRAIKNDP